MHPRTGMPLSLRVRRRPGAQRLPGRPPDQTAYPSRSAIALSGSTSRTNGLNGP
jgi:hypothetical protein